jgi:hypothetical protein
VKKNEEKREGGGEGLCKATFSFFSLLSKIKGRRRASSLFPARVSLLEGRRAHPSCKILFFFDLRLVVEVENHRGKGSTPAEGKTLDFQTRLVKRENRKRGLSPSLSFSLCLDLSIAARALSHEQIASLAPEKEKGRRSSSAAQYQLKKKYRPVGRFVIEFDESVPRR